MLVCKGQWIPRGRTAIVCLAFLEVLMSQPKAGAESQQKLPAFKSSAPCRCICCSTCKQSSAPPAAPAPEQKITEADHFKEWLLQWYAMLETIRYKTSDWCAQRESTFFNLFLFIDIFACCAMCKQSSEPPAPPAPVQKSQKLLASNASAKVAS